MTDITDKQLAANRENAKLGGVKTEEGKAVSRYNAIRHGLLSKQVLLGDEDESELIKLGKTLRTELEPSSEMELLLVDRITANVWRLRRAMQIEREMIDDDRAPFMSSTLKTVGKAFSIDFSQNDTYGKFIRYEANIERGIYKALHELERLQAKARGEHVPLPIAVDVDISGDKNGFVS